MFNGVPHDQLHQFIASSRASSLPLPSFPLHHSQTALISSSFDSFHPHPHPHNQLLPLQQQHHAAQHFLHPILHQQHQPHQESPSCNNSHKTCINEEKEAPNTLVSSANSLEIERERSVVLPEVPKNINAHDPWTNEEVLALLRIRSTMENWFPDFTWEHVSRKLSELGFKRSAEKCKQKFEEESRYLNSINNCTKSSYRFLSELEELYHSEENPPQNETNNISGAQKSQNIVRVLEPNPSEGGGEEADHDQLGSSPTRNDQIDQIFNGAKESELEAVEDEKAEETNENARSKGRKRKRQKRKLEMFKGFCEEIVNKMMCQQEAMHNKLLEDMVKRDKEKVEKEEAWKKQEMDRMNKELEIMAYEQAIAGGRQATIIEFLKKFTSAGTTTASSNSDQSQFSGPKEKDSLNKAVVLAKTSRPTPNDPVSLPSNSSLIQAAHESPNGAPNPTPHPPHENQNNLNIVEELPSSSPSPSSSAIIVRRQNSTLSITETHVLSDQQRNPSATVSKNPNRTKNPSTSSNIPFTTQRVQNDNKEDVGKRWPRDEVLALINLRCGLYNSGEADKDSVVKAPLWERISQGMSELGYKRSAKRCKEKWENINKYFRKTKDVNKKRSVDSRTCPYFHQLSTLYGRGTLVATASEGQEITINHDHHSSQLGSLPPDIDHDRDRHDHHSSVHVAEGEISDNDVVVHPPPPPHHHQHQEVPAAFDFEF